MFNTLESMLHICNVGRYTVKACRIQLCQIEINQELEVISSKLDKIISSGIVNAFGDLSQMDEPGSLPYAFPLKKMKDLEVILGRCRCKEVNSNLLSQCIFILLSPDSIKR